MEVYWLNLHEHKANFDMQDFAQLRFRDSGLTDNPDYTGAWISPYHYANRDADATTAYYSISGWMDGGGYSTGTIQRYFGSTTQRKDYCWARGIMVHVRMSVLGERTISRNKQLWAQLYCGSSTNICRDATPLSTMKTRTLLHNG